MKALRAVLSFLVLCSLDVSAETGGRDFSTTLLVRSYSPALSINPTVGHGQRVWGDSTTPWHGFLRPYIVGVLSPSLYEGKVGLEVFPISVLGLDLKRTWSRRFRTIEGQDCLLQQCLGPLDYTDVSLQSYLGFQGYFSSIRWTRTFFSGVEDKTRPVYEMGASVLLKPDGDAGDYLTIALGKDFEDKFSIGVLLQTADFRYSGHRQEGQYAILKSNLGRFGYDDFDAMLGLGRYKSNLNVAEVSAILSLTYTHTPAIGFGR